MAYRNSTTGYQSYLHGIQEYHIRLPAYRIPYFLDNWLLAVLSNDLLEKGGFYLNARPWIYLIN
jgi:hypothetical protein